MSKTPSIRNARAKDAAALSALAFRSKASNGYDQAFMDACRAELTVDPKACSANDIWLAEDDTGRILGFFDLRIVDGAGEVEALFIEPDLKRTGLGRLLWGKVEQCAADRGARIIGLDADPAAVWFYQSMGLQIVGRAASVSIPGRTLPRMQKRI